MPGVSRRRVLSQVSSLPSPQLWAATSGGPGLRRRLACALELALRAVAAGERAIAGAGDPADGTALAGDAAALSDRQLASRLAPAVDAARVAAGARASVVLLAIEGAAGSAAAARLRKVAARAARAHTSRARAGRCGCGGVAVRREYLDGGCAGEGCAPEQGAEAAHRVPDLLSDARRARASRAKRPDGYRAR